LSKIEPGILIKLFLQKSVLVIRCCNINNKKENCA